MIVKKTVYYIDNQQFYEALCAHRKLVDAAKRKKKTPPQVTQYIGESILKMAQKIGTRSCFVGYSFLEEMIMDGVENCLMYGISNFDPERPNVFAYFTQIITWAFIRRIQKEKKQQYIKLKSVRRHNFAEQLSDNRYMPPADERDNDDFIDKFEKDVAKKKQKRVSP